MNKPEQSLNLNGEFLGISSLAIYSAPWQLQLPLLLLVAYMFYVRISSHSRDIEQLAKTTHNNNDDLEILLSDVNNAFFGFAVTGRNIKTYWTGLGIYLITLTHTVYVTAYHWFILR